METQTVQLKFDIDEEFVWLHLQNGNRCPLFPSEQLNPSNLEGSLQQAVATLMQDLDSNQTLFLG